MESVLFKAIVSLVGSLVLWGLVTKFVTPAIKYDYEKREKLFAFILALLSLSVLWFSDLKYLHHSSFYISKVILSVVFILLVEITFIDFKYKEIPDSYNLGLFILGILYSVNHFYNLVPTLMTSSYNYMLAVIISGFVGCLLYLGIYIFTKGMFGMGDVKMSFGISILSSMFAIMYYPALSSLSTQLVFALANGVLKFTMYSFGMGAIVSLILLALKLKGRKDMIAFGPYIALGFFVHYLITTLMQ